MTSGYREDVDGLRALAVLSVIGFHFEAPRVFGGFVGVDIFFVISGFLITGIIQAEMREGTFSLPVSTSAASAACCPRSMRW